MNPNVKEIPSELLLSHYSIISAQEALATNSRSRKAYVKKRLIYEREIISRLGADWSEFCRVNGWTQDEVEQWMK